MADDALTPNVLKMLGLDPGQLGARYSEASKGLAGATEEITKEQKAFKESAAPIKTKIAETRKEAPSEPKLEDVPDKFQHQGMSQDDLRQNMQIMFALAAIGGAMTRQPMTAALTAFNGAMTGYIKGDQITFERESKTFDENLRRVIAKNNQAVEEYKLAAEKHRNDIQGAMDDLNLLTIEHNDTIGNALIKANKYSDFMKHVENLAASTNKAEGAAEKLRIERDRLNETITHNTELEKAKAEALASKEALAKAKSQEQLRVKYQQQGQALYKDYTTKFNKASSDMQPLITEEYNSSKRLLEETYRNIGVDLEGVSSAATGKEKPTQADRDYVKAHPETRQMFITHFGVEP